MVEFFRKFENRDIKIDRVNSILITKSINLQLFTLILYGVGVRCDRIRFLVLSPFIEKSMPIHIIHTSFITHFVQHSVLINHLTFRSTLKI